VVTPPETLVMAAVRGLKLPVDEKASFSFEFNILRTSPMFSAHRARCCANRRFSRRLTFNMTVVSDLSPSFERSMSPHLGSCTDT
jgi:hypothetical protein